MTPFVSIKALLDGIIDPGNAGNILINGLSLDSRKIKPGNAFLALQGSQFHGVTFAPAALAHGAAIIIAEAPAPAHFSPYQPVIWVDGLSRKVSKIAARFFGEPSHYLETIGVTGTNGKTSIVQFLAQSLHLNNINIATIGTLGTGIYGAMRQSEHTTPDAVTTQALLADFQKQQVTHLAMEVSSHALEQGRVDAVEFDIGVFTNLTRDHLDYHGTMQAYGEAKEKLFAFPSLRCAIINADDTFGCALLEKTRKKNIQMLGYGTGETNSCEIVANDIITTAEGMQFHLSSPWGRGVIKTRLLGRFNISNLLAVAGCLGSLELTFSQIKTTLESLSPVAGRMNRLGGEQGKPIVVIDYAHTPDALEQALHSLSEHCKSRLICVFGCGGERDQGKRSQMGAVAEKFADFVIVTDDNPRTESGEGIIEQILKGFINEHYVKVERDRSLAIKQAVNLAGVDDIVLIAGKGHETYQEVNGKRLPFDDFSVAKAALEYHL